MIRFERISSIEKLKPFENAKVNADCINGSFGFVDDNKIFTVGSNPNRCIVNIERGNDMYDDNAYIISKGSDVRILNLDKINGNILNVTNSQLPNELSVGDKLIPMGNGMLTYASDNSSTYLEVIECTDYGVRVKVNSNVKQLTLTDVSDIGYNVSRRDNTPLVESNYVVCETTAEITNALARATAGQTIYIKGGTYTDFTFKIQKSGTVDNRITIRNYPDEIPVFVNPLIKFYTNVHDINFMGFKFQDVELSSSGFCLKVFEGCSNITIRDLEFTNIATTDATTLGVIPLRVHGGSDIPISNVLIDNCYIHDCETGWSESLTIAGNVKDSKITHCTIENTGNIGIDIAGNYHSTGVQGDPNNQARNILVEKNLIITCKSPNASSAGLYIDGARNTTLAYNIVYDCHVGISLGAEQEGADVKDNFVHHNLIVNCGRGITIGRHGNSVSTKLYNTTIYNNTMICDEFVGLNSTSTYGTVINNTSDLEFYNNITYSFDSETEIYRVNSSVVTSNINVHDNCWYIVGVENGKPSVDETGIYANPLFTDVDNDLDGDFTLTSSSPCIGMGAYN